VKDSQKGLEYHDSEALNKLHFSSQYQSLIVLRQEAVDIEMLAYVEQGAKIHTPPF
jgi:uncharacterized protein (DUF1330 family)